MASNSPEDPVVLVTLPSDVEATLIAEALQEANIEAEVTDAAASAFRVGAPGGVHVLVKQKDLAQAKTELKRIKEESAHIDWSKIEVGDPEPEE